MSPPSRKDIRFTRTAQAHFDIIELSQAFRLVAYSASRNDSGTLSAPIVELRFSEVDQIEYIYA